MSLQENPFFIDLISTVPRGIPLEKTLSNKELASIYSECEKTRSIPQFILDESGQKIGWTKYSIDAWCE